MSLLYLGIIATYLPQFENIMKAQFYFDSTSVLLTDRPTNSPLFYFSEYKEKTKRANER